MPEPRTAIFGFIGNRNSLRLLAAIN